MTEIDERVARISADAWRTSSTYFDANIRRDAENDLRQWKNLHARGSKYLSDSYRGRSRLFVPKTRAAITKAEAQAAEAFFSSMDVVNFTPDDPDDHVSVGAAKFFQNLVQIRLSRPAPQGLPWFLTCIGAYQDAHATGIVVSKSYWDKGNDRPMVDLVPLENFRFDPASDWRDPVSTSPYLIQQIPMYVRDIKRRAAEGKWLPVEDADLMKARAVSDTIRLTREGQRTDSQALSHEINDFNVIIVREYIADLDGVDMVWYTLESDKVLSVPEPVGEKYAHGRPYVVGFVNLETHVAYKASTPKLTRDVQRELNDLRNQRMDNISFVLNKRYFAKRNKQIDLGSLTRNVAGSVTLMEDPDTDVRVVETPDVTSSSFNEQDRLNLDFDDIAGHFDSSSVQANRKLNETATGMKLLSSNANQVSAYKLRTFTETWVEPTLRQIAELERAYETDEGVIMAAMRGAKIPPELVGEAVWMQPVRLSVNVGMSATSPTEKANLLLFGMNAIKTIMGDGQLESKGLNAREVVSEIMAMIGYRDGSRFFAWGEDDPVVGGLQQQIQSLQQQLAAKQPPELIAAQVAKMQAETDRILAQKVAEGVKAAYAAMQAGQVIASVPSVAPIADEVMKGAGWQPGNGVDPNFPQPATRDPALAQGDVMDPRTGVSFVPPGGVDPQTGAVGMGAGIETARPDGVSQ